MSSFEILYFPITGRVQTARTILSLANANWKNVVPDWPAIKESLPFGRLPLLTETAPDGSKYELVESTAIDRYLARKFGYLPSDNKIASKLESYALQIADSYDKLIDHAYGANSDESKAAFEKELEFLLKHHEPILAANPSGHYHGESTTYPDIVLYTLYNQSKVSGNADLFKESEFPHILKLVTSMDSNTRIAQAIATIE
ncbi:putative glutathione S-transferase 6 [Smittium culicis]|uniref:Putative glutathione S-transferase 6 n=2 Tax=Smittium culicis TaxID=133412 RepID=A0A1R1XCQ0_9FUNG|nr:putative glutathione S-transferase 6 [Smittium culicis]